VAGCVAASHLRYDFESRAAPLKRREVGPRNVMRNLSIVAVLFLLSACPKSESMLTEVANHAKDRAGQTWRYHARPGEEGSTLTILRVDQDKKLGVIVHISVSGVRIEGAGRSNDHIGHLPFAEAAIDRSVTTLVSQGQPSPLPEGYTVWRHAYERSHGGIFTVSVAEAVGFVEQSLKQPPRPK
jgi:hypothetical protein